MKEKGLILFFGLVIVLFSLTFISTASPFTSQQLAAGYQIQIPSDNILKQNQDYSFDFHLSNITNGYPIILGTTCFFHIYNSSGNHIVEMTQSSPMHDFDFEFNVKGGNFSKLGGYYYFINCNSTSIGGANGDIIRITVTGEETTIPDGIFYVGILVILIVFLIIALSKIASTENYGWTVGYISISYFLLLSVLFITYQVSLNFLTLIPYISSILYITFLITLILMFPLFLIGVIYLLSKLAGEREINELVEMGYDREEAKKFKRKK